MQCGIVEDKWYDCIHLTTHLIAPGQLSFESNPFTPITKIIHIQNISYKPDVFCQIQLKGDEFWKYTKIGNFSDYFMMEYVDNSILSIKSSDSTKSSEEININISENFEKVFENSFGKFKINSVEDIKPFDLSKNWKCNIYVKELAYITKKSDIFYLPEINNIPLGYTYDGNISKYISIVINSIQTDELTFILYKKKKGKKKEYAKGFLKISELQLGIIEEKTICFTKHKLLGTKPTNKTIKLSLHITSPYAQPFINLKFNPLIMHIYLIEAINIPKTDITSKSDPYVLFKFEGDKIGIKSKALENTLTPQWNELLDLTITDANENLIVEIWDKNMKKDKFICKTLLDTKKYMNFEPHFEWIKINNIFLNLVIHIKPFGDNYISREEVNFYQLSPIPNN